MPSAWKTRSNPQASQKGSFLSQVHWKIMLPRSDATRAIEQS